MMKHLREACAIAVLALLTGCGNSASVWVSPDVGSVDSRTYAVMAFENRLPNEQQKDYPEAAEVVRDAFETAMLGRGARLVERAKVEHLLAELARSKSPMHTTENAVKVGRLANAGAVVWGAAHSFFRGKAFGRYTTVGFSVKAVDAETGAILWKGSHTKSTKFDYDYEPSALAEEVAQEIAEKLPLMK